jgi:hypothetical protein
MERIVLELGNSPLSLHASALSNKTCFKHIKIIKNLFIKKVLRICLMMALKILQIERMALHTISKKSSIELYEIKNGLKIKWKKA